MSETTTINAFKILGDSLARGVNEHLEAGGSDLKQALGEVEKRGMASRLDYSEQSIPILLTVLSVILNDPNGNLATILIKRLSLERKDRSSALVDMTLWAQFYMDEMACRNLGAKWKIKKGFFTGTKIGIELPNGEFVHTAPRTKGLLVGYEEIKDRIAAG